MNIEERAKKAEYMRKYMSLPANKEKKAAWDKRYVEKNKEKVAARKKAYQEKNKQHLSDYHKAWDKKPESQEKIRAYTKARIESGGFRRYRLRKYGITLEQYSQMLEMQDHRCAICRKHQSEMNKSMPIDHDHKTGQVRGLLCEVCNRAIGMLKDDPNIIDRASNYLRKYTIQS